MRIMATHGLVHHDALNFKVVNFLKPNQPNASTENPRGKPFLYVQPDARNFN